MNLYRWNLERWLDWRFRVGDARLDILDRVELTYDDSRLTRVSLKISSKTWEINFGEHDWGISFFRIRKRDRREEARSGFITRSIFLRDTSRWIVGNTISFTSLKYRSKRNLKLLPNCHWKPIGSFLWSDRINRWISLDIFHPTSSSMTEDYKR